MSNEAMIGKVVADLRAGRVTAQTDDQFLKTFRELSTLGPVINATAVFQSMMTDAKPIDAYGDNPQIAPPWDAATICYVNTHGNANVMLLGALDRQRGDTISEWETTNEVRWNEVRWTIMIAVYVGGWSDTTKRHIPTSGPMLAYSVAVYETGEPADVHWIDILGFGEEVVDEFKLCMLTVLATLNFVNCRNVELVDVGPTLHRAEARRLARTGINMQILNVYPAGVTRRSDKRDTPLGVPLTSVRGHFASYGERYGRGKLFGRYEGRFWIPQHARGSKELGENVNDYDLKATS